MNSVTAQSLWWVYELACVAGLLYNVVMSVTRGFDRYRAGQIVMVVGWMVLGMPSLLMRTAGADAWQSAQVIGAIGVAAGLWIIWLGKRDEKQRSAGRPEGGRLVG